MNGILLIAHAPLASALRQCVLHVFPDASDAVTALDVQPNVPPEETLAQARAMLRQMDRPPDAGGHRRRSVPRPATWRRSWSMASTASSSPA